MSGRARRCAVFLGLPLLFIAPGSAARAEDRAGVATQSGWWNRLQGPADGEPEGNPVRPFVPAVPTSATVPSDAIAVSASGGQADKVAAVGIDPAVTDGAGVEAVSLRLLESPAGGANVASDKAKVVACPATGPWGPSRNAAWRDRPAADCGLASVDGVRASDGAWGFNLTPIVRLWTDPRRPLANNGVVLSVDTSGSPRVVQVSWDDVDTGTVAVYVTATPATPSPAVDRRAAEAGPVASASAAPEPAAGVATAGTATPSPALLQPPGPDGRGGDVGSRSGLAATIADPAPTDAVGPTRGSGGVPQAIGAAPPGPNGAVAPARPAVGFWEHVPAPAALLVPLAAGLTVLVGLVLGPRGRPSPVFRREGGLSRALARRAVGAGPAGLRPPAARG